MTLACETFQYLLVFYTINGLATNIDRNIFSSDHDNHILIGKPSQCNFCDFSTQTAVSNCYYRHFSFALQMLKSLNPVFSRNIAHCDIQQKVLVMCTLCRIKF